MEQENENEMLKQENEMLKKRVAELEEHLKKYTCKNKRKLCEKFFK